MKENVNLRDVLTETKESKIMEIFNTKNFLIPTTILVPLGQSRYRVVYLTDSKALGILAWFINSCLPKCILL